MYLKYAPSAERKPDMSEWIDVNERLPPIEGQYYLVLGQRSDGYYTPDILRYEGSTGQVKYWMEIPKPPKKHNCKVGNQTCELTPEGRLHLWEEGYHPNYPTPGPRSLAFVKYCPFCGAQADKYNECHE